jgi:hypothetical protein
VLTLAAVEDLMVTLLRWSTLVLALGCTSVAHAADLDALVGTWGGVVRGVKTVDQDWVEMTIAPDGGYEAVSYRQIGVFRSHGQIQSDGERLRYVSEKGQGSLQLGQRADGTPVLKLSGTLPPIGNVTADLTRAARR